MKGYLSLLFGSLMVALMLIVPGNAAFAAEPTEPTADHECGCDVSILTGAERNKLVSDLIKSDAYKAVKLDLENQGYMWNGADATEIIINHSYGDMTLAGAKFTAEDGTQYAFAFLYVDGIFYPMELVQD